MVRIAILSLIFAICAATPGARAQSAACADSLDPYLSVLAEWSAGFDSSLDYAYCTFVTGAAFAAGYTPERGFFVPARQEVLWPGNLFQLHDSLYAPVRAFRREEAESLLTTQALAGTRILLAAARPVVVSGCDTSLGAPWLFVEYCDSGRSESSIWDLGDLRIRWWSRGEVPGAHLIWPFPKKGKAGLGRSGVLAGMRNTVLAARPDSTGATRYGLAALSAAVGFADTLPGSWETLSRMTTLRQQAADFLTEYSELWPPSEREPIKLAAFYLQKDAEAWRTLSTVVASWESYDHGQRRDWLGAVQDWETKAAVALDQIVSQ